MLHEKIEDTFKFNSEERFNTSKGPNSNISEQQNDYIYTTITELR